MADPAAAGREVTRTEPAMSHPPFAPGIPPRPAAPRRPAAAKPKRLRWGILEWFLVFQYLTPGLLFVPGVSSFRVVVRIFVFLIPLVTWFLVVRSGRSAPGGAFPAATWLKMAVAWLGLCIFHPKTSSMPAGVAQALLYIAVFSPAFWVPKGLSSPRQIGRLMMLLLACNSLSALLGLAQVFRPETFNPPVIPGITGFEEGLVAQALTISDASGRKILRPCGLTDSPGAAAGAGGAAFLAGLALSLRPIGLLRRLVCLGAAFGGMAVIYYSQVRMIFVMELLCLVSLGGVFVLQKNFRYATMLGGLGAALIIGAFSWVVATSGQVVIARFLSLSQQSLTSSLEGAGRTRYIEHTLTVQIWEDPLGSGIGRWGTVGATFGSMLGQTNDAGVFTEIMIQGWANDGGIPLLLLYGGAIAAAMLSTFRVAVRSPDEEVRFWAAMAFASNLSTVATCLSWTTFISSLGIQFWFLAAVVYAADAQARADLARRARALRARPQQPPGPPYRPAPQPPYPTAPA